MSPNRDRSRPGGDGYTLVALVVIFSVMTILLAAAMPFWSQVIQRDKEEELIFRGMQYAEAIRVFQLRQGRYPVTLEELVKTRPRSIRRLYEDPMTEGGKWGLIFAQAAGGGRPGQPGQPRGRVGAGGRTAGNVAPQRPGLQTGLQTGAASDLAGGSGPGGRRGEVVTVGPIIGVHSLSKDSGTKVFFGSKQYSSWQFTVNIVPVAVVEPGTLLMPRVSSQTLGRPFPDDLSPQDGDMPEGLVLPGGLPRTNPGDRRGAGEPMGSGDRRGSGKGGRG